MRSIDIQALTLEAFGYGLASKRLSLPGALGTPDRPRAQPAGPELHGDAGLGLLGLPLFCKVIFGDAHGPNGGAAGLELLDPIITVAQPQIVLKTPIAGRNGTVKEYIGQSDFAVTIQALLATDPYSENRFAYPLQLVQALRDLIAVGVALPVSGHLQTVFGIKNLVIENPTYQALPGYTNLQAVELQCVSDEPIELLL
jgi:hypothetical protein